MIKFTGPQRGTGQAGCRLMDPENIATAFWKSPKGVVITGAHGRILATNPVFCEILGYTDSELKGSLSETIVPAEDRKLRMAERVRLLAGEPGTGPAPTRYLHRDGHIVTVIESCTLLCGNDGAVAGVFALIDVTSDEKAVLVRHPVPHLLQAPVFQPPIPLAWPVAIQSESESGPFFTRLFEVSGEAVIVVDTETSLIIACNPQAADLVGRSRDAIIGTPQAQLYPEGEKDHYCDLFHLRAHQPGRQSSEVLIQRADGGTVPAEITSTVMDWCERFLMVCIIKDITERRRTEAALLAFANRMHAILSSMFDAVITADSQGIIETFNDAAERLFGWRAYEMIGRSVTLLVPQQAHDQNDTLISNFRRGASARIIGKERELLAQRKDGSLIPIELAITEIIDRGEYFEGDHRTRRRSFVGVIRDITERKTTEAALLAAKSQAELANRAKSEFLAHMSHELRTPLNAIIGFSEILMRELFGAMLPRYVEYAGTIYESGQHLLRIINDLLDMARIDAGRFDLIEDEMDIPSVVESCLTMVRTRAEDGGVTLDAHLADRLPHIRADRRSVMQVLLNLLSNSVKFTPNGGVVTVSAGVDDSGRMIISVTDTGEGIDTEMLPRIFEPFQQADSRLSRKLEGTGLGLAISRNLMELHGGSLDIVSQIGSNTVASMGFPASRVMTTGA